MTTVIKSVVSNIFQELKDYKDAICTDGHTCENFLMCCLAVTVLGMMYLSLAQL